MAIIKFLLIFMVILALSFIAIGFLIRFIYWMDDEQTTWKGKILRWIIYILIVGAIVYLSVLFR